MYDEDLRSKIPSDLANRLLENERVLYYASGGGCLSGGKSYFLLTNNRAMTCGNMEGKQTNLDIPLEHVSSTGTEKSGCLSQGGVITISSGTATQRVQLANSKAAEEASMVLQKVLNERKKW